MTPTPCPSVPPSTGQPEPLSWNVAVPALTSGASGEPVGITGHHPPQLHVRLCRKQGDAGSQHPQLRAPQAAAAQLRHWRVPWWPLAGGAKAGTRQGAGVEAGVADGARSTLGSPWDSCHDGME